MATARRLAGTLLILIAAGCGQVEPVILTVEMMDCVYRGPDSMVEGQARLTLSLNGLGNAGTALVKVAAGHHVAELARHLEETPEGWNRLPRWVEIESVLRLRDDQGLGGVSETLRLDEGEYAVVCITHPYSPDGGVTASVASRLDVSEG